MSKLPKRLQILLSHIDQTQLGIEVAPYFNPALPKASSKNILILDVFDTETLRENARKDPLIAEHRISEIEPVDLVGDAGNIAAMVAEKGLTGQIGFIVSSHNFEHLSNPIRFLQGCYTSLKPGGVLSMAVPDARACFDIFRMPTRLIDWIAAYHSERVQPSAETIFDVETNSAQYVFDGETQPGVALGSANPDFFHPHGSLRGAYANYKENLASTKDYQDAHCNVMIPETLRLMLQDARHLGLIDFEIIEISETRGLEFFVHLRKPLEAAKPQDEASYLAERATLMRRINYRLGAFGYVRAPALSRLRMSARFLKSGLKSLVGLSFYNKVREANRARKIRNRKSN
ncbi:adenine phosphoribosyltransferase [Pseudorhodobacter sp. E13]|uniref:methyltransferase domain-containing protein n=1 Tax=Pseudorhodobacter sp. E13 TaxID=2487931 RepID=UPI000F8D0972|nr:methyltransferase domain-containing protein [Pseudorhodobacter sp. E13]RUS63281.1 adenine phosphoribosyltransferase [Pseudorhodobacter sp. E13]